ncbi:MAG: VWA domain-containing protein [Armatimonadetes bacterium]|nr:VWA domain-containing protein [Armatimonadota bacterium]
MPIKRLGFCVILICLASAAFASGNTSEYGPILEAMAASGDGPKEIAVVVDKSGSMGESLQAAKDLVAALIRKVIRPGDRFSLINFDSRPETVIEREEVTDANKEDLVSRLPMTWSTQRGTNIRWAHHEALKLLDRSQAPGAKFLILITDGYNDAPAQDDLDYATYRLYCDDRNPQALPDTPESKDYRRLLEKMGRARNFHTMGIGVEIRQNEPQLIPVTGKSEASGLERVQPALDEARVKIEEVTGQPAPPPAQEKHSAPWAMIALAAVVALALLIALLLKALTAPVWIRMAQISPQDKGNVRFYILRPGGTIEIGGASQESQHAFPLPGVAAIAATVKRAMKGFTFVPESGVSAYINGEAVAGAAPVRIDDSIRVVVSTPQGEQSFTLSFQQTTREAMAESGGSKGFDFTRGL